MATVAMSEMSIDASIAGTERLLAQGADGSVILVSAIAAYAVDQLHGATVITSLSGTDEVVVFQSDVEKIITVTNLAAWVVDTVEAATVGTSIVAGDWIIYSDAGVLKRITLTNFLAGVASITTAISGLDIDGGTDIGAALADADLIIVDDGAGGTNRKSALSRLWTYISSKIQAMSAKTTPVDADILMIQDSADSSALKELTVGNLWDNLYVADLAAITNVKAYSWVVDEDTLVSNLDTKVPTQQSVKAYVDAAATFSVHDATQLNAIPAIDDYVAVSDESTADDPNRGVTVAELLGAAGDVTDLAAAPAIDDRLLLTDESETGDPARSMTVQNLFNALSAGPDAFTGSIVPGTDQLLIDDGGTSKRVTCQVFFDGIDDLTAIGAAPATTDSVLLDDGGVAEKCTVANLHLTYFKDMTPGTGISTGTNTICEHSVYTVGGLIKTEILLDLTGLADDDAANDVIGKPNDTANCHIGRILAATNGTIVAGKITCFELPAGGDPDIDFLTSSDATGAQGVDSTGLAGYAKLIDHGGDWAAGEMDVLSALPAANQYIYMACGTATDATYTAGIFLVELWGT